MHRQEGHCIGDNTHWYLCHFEREQGESLSSYIPLHISFKFTARMHIYGTITDILPTGIILRFCQSNLKNDVEQFSQNSVAY